MEKALLLDNQQFLHMKPISVTQMWVVQLLFLFPGETCSVPARTEGQ